MPPSIDLARHGTLGSPEGKHFDAAQAQSRPLSAFTLLLGGDVFEQLNARPSPEAQERAKRYLAKCVEIQAQGAGPEQVKQVKRDILRLVSGNVELVQRLEVARPLDVVLVPPNKPFSAYGFPKGTSPNTIGLFWDHPSWDRARIALQREKLGKVPQLMVHEMAHAIHFLAFTDEERKLIYRLLLRTFGSRSAVDEVFAIYSEREFLDEFTEEDKRGPDVYGLTRRRWSEDHVFTRFVRLLYFPYKPLAGPKMEGAKMRSLLGG